MKCPKCRAENAETARYCSNCAAPLASGTGAQSIFTTTLESQADKLARGTLFAKRYEIIDELGAGGMGRVYRAEDTKVKEQVALKLIRPEIGADRKTIDRFRNELKIARRIRHKNVTGMYDLGEEKGIHYITMEYVPGEDLKSLIRRVGQLPIAKSVSIAEQVCEGLAEAHGLGIVHRDLKPANIMIDRDGNARIMDFGIARSLGAPGVTEVGVMIGTPEYMSPEQAEGEDIDQRSDIYSLGIILYVMLTGRPPFQADTALDLLLKHKTEKPRDPSELNPLIPESLSRVILKCLEKDKDKRWTDVRELLATLRAVGEPEAGAFRSATDITSVAVLAFRNMSADPENEHFSDGLSESIINSLSQVRGFRVVARTSAFSFKGRDVDIREIGRRLNVDHILEGSVQKAGNRIRITAQLIKVKDGFHLWSEQFDRALDDIFSIQDEISLQILDNLKVRLQGREKDRVLKRYTVDIEAYTLYLKGRYYWNKMSKEGIEKALEYFHQVIQHDSYYAPAYAGIADGHALCSWYHYSPPSKALPLAKTYAQKALEIDDGISEAHSVLGFVKMLYERDWQNAGHEFKRAVELNPGNTNNLFYYSVYFSALGRHEESVAVAKRALEIDPISVLLIINLAMRFFYKRQFDDALKQAEKAIELDRSSFVGHFYSGFIYLYRGMYGKALEKIELARKLLGGPLPPHYHCCLGLIHAFSGETEKAERVLRELIETQDPESPSMSLVPWVYIALGRTDEAFERLEEAFRAHNPMMIWIKSDPIFERVRSDPRYTALLGRMGLLDSPSDAGNGLQEASKASSRGAEIPAGKGAAAELRKSIIVLPFENISPDPEQEYFCDGMTEEIITDLSHIHDLLVISRNSAMTFKGTKKKTREIARDVNVRYVLEGSVRKAGNSLRITAQLIDAETDAHLWAEKYTGTLDDVFDIQEKVSRSIAGALKLKLTSDESQRIAHNPIPDVYAYECFLKARHELWKWTEEGLQNALDYLQKGLDIVGESAVLLAGMGYVYFQYSNTGINTDEITLQKAEDYTNRALEADPESPTAHIVLALLRGWRGHPQAATRHFKRALAVEPNNFDGLVWLPCFCAYLGKTKAILPYVERLLLVEPNHPLSHFTHGLVDIMNGNFNAALHSLGTAYARYPQDCLIQWIYGQVLLYSHLCDQANSVIEKMLKNAPDFVWAKLALSTALGLRKKRTEALSLLEDPKIEALARCDFGASYYLAESHAVLDQKREALDWLEHAVDLGFMNFPFLNELNPLLANIRAEPRFKELMERVKREWEDFEV